MTLMPSVCASLAHAGAARGDVGFETRILGDIQQGLLDEVRHQAGIRAVRQHGGRRLLASPRSRSASKRMV